MKSTPSHILKGEVNYVKIGLTTVATQDLLSRMPLIHFLIMNSSAFVTVYYLNKDNSVPNWSTSLHARTNHTINRCYRTVNIPRLVVSYETHKGNRWLNSKTPSQGRQNLFVCFLYQPVKFQLNYWVNNSSPRPMNSLQISLQSILNERNIIPVY